MRAAAIALVAVAAAACTSRRTVGQPSVSVVDAAIDVRRDVDLLFMIDDSLGTSPKTAALVSRFPVLFDRIQQLASVGKSGSFHIGVVDSDLGAGLNTQGCKPGGDGGKLRTGPNPGSIAPAACSGWSLPGGFIDYDSASGASNTGGLDVPTAYGCLAAVGNEGCGFEAPLEAIDQALQPDVNPGFLRADALLVVILMTDEDDCSAPPDTTLFDPSPAGTAKWGVLDSFRCTHWGIVCDGMQLDGGALAPRSDCTPVSGGPLFDVSRYLALFAPGGVKSTSDDLVLATIVAPSSPFGVTVTAPCADQPNSPSCPILNHSCTAASDSNFFADPAVRINTVTASVPNAITGSVCDPDYTPTIEAVADAMTTRVGTACLPGAILDLQDSGCSVSVDAVEVPRCAAPGHWPCWDVIDDMICPERLTPGGARQNLRFVVEGAPPSAAISAVCPLYEPSP